MISISVNYNIFIAFALFLLCETLIHAFYLMSFYCCFIILL